MCAHCQIYQLLQVRAGLRDILLSFSGLEFLPGIEGKAGREKLSLSARGKMNGERYVGLALDYSPSSRYALKWAIDNCLRENDHLIIVVVHKDVIDEAGQAALWESHGTPLIPLAVAQEAKSQQNYQLKIDEQLKADISDAVAKKIVVVFKVYWGDPKEKLCSAVLDTPLDFLILGCRGLSSLRRTFLGSVSNYVANNVPCPVTIVKLPPN